MRMHSVFCFRCICGRSIETPERAGNCPECNRLFVLDWGRSEELAQENLYLIEKHARWLERQARIRRVKERLGIAASAS